MLYVCCTMKNRLNKTRQIGLRCSPQEYAEWQEVARRRQMKLAEFVRFLVRQALEKENKAA
jgi:hypothetical protein